MSSRTVSHLICSRCGQPIAASFEPGRCYMEDCEPEEMDFHDEAMDEGDECPACRINRLPPPEDDGWRESGRPYPVGQHAMAYLSGVRAVEQLGLEEVRDWLCPLHLRTLELFVTARLLIEPVEPPAEFTGATDDDVPF